VRLNIDYDIIVKNILNLVLQNQFIK